MKRSIIAILLVSIASTLYSQDQAKSDAQRFIVLYTIGESWDTTKTASGQLHFKEHSAHLARLRAAGTIELGARFGDTGMIIVRAKNKDEAHAIVSDDEAIRNRLFKTEIFSFHAFYTGCIE